MHSLLLGIPFLGLPWMDDREAGLRLLPDSFPDQIPALGDLHLNVVQRKPAEDISTTVAGKLELYDDRFSNCCRRRPIPR